MPSKRASRKRDERTKKGSAHPTLVFNRDDRPKLLIVAGPNGAGKTTVFQDTVVQDVGRTVWIINPDFLAARIRSVERLGSRKANLEAVRRIEKWLKTSIAAHQTIGVETVLSTAKYRKLVRAAKRMNFEILLVYVLLKSPELHVARVQLRVKKGGHAVPKNKILSRRKRSLEQLPWFLKHSDIAWLYDNSGAKPRLIGIKRNNLVLLDNSVALPEIAQAAGQSQAV